jgi:HAE1 family hydrophobic/amphiphilic exporter-1
MGIIMMAGIVVEYSIILLEFANQRVRDGLSVRDAIREATWIRLRPILMTSLTTWLALVPMAIGAAGGEANAPLARAVIGGVLAATVLSLTVIPCMYVMVKRAPKLAEAVA